MARDHLPGASRGHEVVGVIDAVGQDVPEQWKPGQRVGVGWHAWHCPTSTAGPPTPPQSWRSWARQGRPRHRDARPGDGAATVGGAKARRAAG